MKTLAIAGIQVIEITVEEKNTLSIEYGLKVVSSQPWRLYDPNVNESYNYQGERGNY